MKTLIISCFVVCSTLLSRAQFAGEYSGYCEPLKCKAGYSAYTGDFSFTVYPNGSLRGELEYDPANHSWIDVTGRVMKSGRIVFEKELRREKIRASMKITKEGTLTGKWKSKYCRGEIGGWNHF